MHLKTALSLIISLYHMIGCFILLETLFHPCVYPPHWFVLARSMCFDNMNPGSDDERISREHTEDSLLPPVPAQGFLQISEERHLVGSLDGRTWITNDILDLSGFTRWMCVVLRKHFISVLYRCLWLCMQDFPPSAHFFLPDTLHQPALSRHTGEGEGGHAIPLRHVKAVKHIFSNCCVSGQRNS